MENHPLQYRWRIIHCNTDGEPSTAIQMENYRLQYRWRTIHCNTNGELSTAIGVENHPLQYRWRTIHCNVDGEPSTAIQMDKHPLQYRWRTIHCNTDGEPSTAIKMENHILQPMEGISNVARWQPPPPPPPPPPKKRDMLIVHTPPTNSGPYSCYLDPGYWLLVRRSEGTSSHQLRSIFCYLLNSGSWSEGVKAYIWARQESFAYVGLCKEYHIIICSCRYAGLSTYSATM